MGCKHKLWCFGLLLLFRNILNCITHSTDRNQFISVDIISVYCSWNSFLIQIFESGFTSGCILRFPHCLTLAALTKYKNRVTMDLSQSFRRIIKQYYNYSASEVFCSCVKFFAYLQARIPRCVTLSSRCWVRHLFPLPDVKSLFIPSETPVVWRQPPLCQLIAA